MKELCGSMIHVASAPHHRHGQSGRCTVCSLDSDHAHVHHPLQSFDSSVMETSMAGKVVIVTGANSGLGFQASQVCESLVNTAVLHLRHVCILRCIIAQQLSICSDSDASPQPPCTTPL